MISRSTSWQRRALLFALLGLPSVALAAAPAASPPAAPVAAGVDPGRLDAQVTAAYAPGDPGAAVLVAQGDQVLLRKGYGLASVELGVPIEPDMVFRLGSITKQFTAVAILMLAEQGKLRLDQKVSETLPDYPKAQGEKVRIDHLLSHTSGIPSYTGIPEFWKHERKDLSAAEMFAFFAELPLEFTPGERFEYSNSGYYVLGQIIEKVSGESYADFVEKHIFTPAGMTASLYDNPLKRVPRRVAGHQMGEDGIYAPAPYLSMSGPYAAGALASTVDDLRRWNEALLAGKLISRASLEKAWTPYTLNDGKKSNYGFGWGIGQYAGQRLISHNGGIHGFTTSMLLFPEKQLTIAVLSNGNELDPELVSQRLAMTLFGHQDEFKTIELPVETLAKFAGVYKISATSRRVVRLEGGKLVTSRDGGRSFPASPISATEFLYDGQNDRFRFELDSAGKVTSMRMLRWGEAEPEVAERTDEKLPELPKFIEVEPAELDKLIGKYELQPGFVLAVRRQGAKLVTQATGQGEIPLEAISATEFAAPAVGARLVFELEGGQAKSLTLHQGGQVLPAKRID